MPKKSYIELHMGRPLVSEPSTNSGPHIDYIIPEHIQPKINANTIISKLLSSIYFIYYLYYFFQSISKYVEDWN